MERFDEVKMQMQMQIGDGEPEEVGEAEKGMMVGST